MKKLIVSALACLSTISILHAGSGSTAGKVDYVWADKTQGGEFVIHLVGQDPTKVYRVRYSSIIAPMFLSMALTAKSGNFNLAMGYTGPTGTTAEDTVSNMNVMMP
jgi:hypothetical protein